ncbi:MAG: dihydrodipicolinate synthase family protein [Sedimentisphaerales bacterium]
MKRFGVLSPIVIPCGRDGKPDIEGVKSVCHYMLQNGCHGIFVASSTGRGPWFSRDDNAQICKAVADYVGAKTPVFAGCMGTGLAEMLQTAYRMADMGAKVAVLTSPCYFNYSQQELEIIFEQFADYSPIPVMVYDIPVFAGTKLDVHMIGRLSRHQNIIGFKDSSSDFKSFSVLISILDDAPNFCLMQGKEHLLADALIAGGSGIVVSLLHIHPEPFVALYNAVISQNHELARNIQLLITKMMKIVEECFRIRPEVSTLFHIINYVMKKRGICENILLDYEGECPVWLANNAEKTMEIIEEARVLIHTPTVLKEDA